MKKVTLITATLTLGLGMLLGSSAVAAPVLSSGLAPIQQVVPPLFVYNTQTDLLNFEGKFLSLPKLG